VATSLRVSFILWTGFNSWLTAGGRPPTAAFREAAMGFLDGMLGKGGKWFDCGKTLQGVAGTLSRMPAPQIKEDGIFGAYLVPDDKAILNNRKGARNKNDMLELRVRLPEAQAAGYLSAVKSLMDRKVWATGALVNDDAKDGKAELHPVDVLWGRLAADLYPEWVKGMMTTLRDPATEVQVFRLAAASDASKSGAPAPALSERLVKLVFPYPAKGSAPNPELKYEIKATASLNADFQINHERIRERLELVINLKPAKAEGGPVLFAADMVIFWN
jgi:hypothetical protein